MFKQKNFLLTPVFLFAFGTAIAQDISILTENFPSETEKIGENQVSGIGGDIVTKALEAKKISFKMVWSPWKRAQQETLANSDKKSFVIPLTRNSEREASYNWVAKLYDADTAFLTLKSNKKLDSIADAKGKKIGVLLGSSYEGFIADAKHGLNKADIEAVPNDATNAKKLDAGKIYGWYSGVIGAVAALKAEKIDIGKIDIGKNIDREENYIATAKNTPAELANKVKDAIESFKKTPQYAAIIKKYAGK
nr:ABC transporter substrate-binding protein [Pigmentibacter ruber]